MYWLRNAYRSILCTILATLTIGCTEITQVSVFETNLKPNNGGFFYSLPLGLLNITMEQSATNDQKPTISLTQKVVADQRTRFRLDFKESLISSDHFTAEVNAEGLLQSSESTNDDKTVEIVKSAMQIVTDSGKMIFMNPLKTAETSEEYYIKEIYIDPFNANSKALAQNSLERSKYRMEISYLDGSSVEPLSNQEVISIAAACQGSVCFRTLVPILVTMKGQTPNKTSLAVEKRQIITVPDPRSVVKYDTTRATCVKRVTKLGFTSGVLTKVDLDAPSQMLGCLNIPLEIIKSVVAIPGAVFAYQTSNLNSEKGYLKAQTELLAAQTELLAAQVKAKQSTGASAN